MSFAAWMMAMLRTPIDAIAVAKGRAYALTDLTQAAAGDKIGYVNAFIDAALRREDVAPLVRAHLKEIGWRAPGER